MTILEIIVLLPILAAVVIALGSPARITAIVASALAAIATLVSAIGFPLNEETDKLYHFSSHSLLQIDGFPHLSLSFGIDGISLVLMILTVIVLVAAIWSAPSEEKIKGSPRIYYASCLLIGGGALGAFCSADLFFLYAFHELALIPTFLMIGLFGSGENRVRTAWTITIYLGIGSIVLLIGLIMAVVNLGGNTFEIAALVAAAEANPIAPETQNWVYLLLLVGFGILVSLFPFHSWAPPAYAQAPTPVSMLHAGVLKKFGLYGLIRIAQPLAPQGAETWLNLVLVLLLGNILYIGLVTIAQKDLNRMLGYSSVMHMGYVFLGVVSGTSIGMNGAVLLMFAHGVSIALLFALTGALKSRYGTLEISALGGIAKSLPGLSLLFGFAAFASAGLPGFANFAAEVLVFFGAFQRFDGTMGALQWATILALWGVVISAVYMLRAYRHVFKGPQDLKLPVVPRMGWQEKAPILILLISLMLVGFIPELLVKYLRPAVDAMNLFVGN